MWFKVQAFFLCYSFLYFYFTLDINFRLYTFSLSLSSCNFTFTRVCLWINSWTFTWLSSTYTKHFLKLPIRLAEKEWENLDHLSWQNCFNSSVFPGRLAWAALFWSFHGNLFGLRSGLWSRLCHLLSIKFEVTNHYLPFYFKLCRFPSAVASNPGSEAAKNHDAPYTMLHSYDAGEFLAKDKFKFLSCLSVENCHRSVVTFCKIETWSMICLSPLRYISNF